MMGSRDGGVSSNYRDCLQQLSNPDFVYSEGKHRLLTSLALSIRSDGRVVEWCTERGGETLLHLLCKPLPDKCCSENYIISVTNLTRLFVLNGGQINARDKVNGLTALHYAIRSRHYDVVECLLRHKASPDEMSTTLGDTALHMACMSWRPVNVAKELSYLDMVATDLNTELLKSVDLLLRHRASIHMQNHCGETPLHKAAEHGATPLAEILLRRGSKLNALDIKGNTPLHAVYTNYSTAIAKSGIEQMLLSWGAEINRRNHQGRVPVIPVYIEFEAGQLSTTPTPTHPSTSSLLLHIVSGLDVRELPPVALPPSMRGQVEKTALCCELITVLYEAGYPLQDLKGCGQCSNGHEDNLLDTLQYTPLSLRRTAAKVIRVNLKPNALVGVTDLPLPSHIKHFILLKDLAQGMLTFPETVSRTERH